jgi:hypothetical protein
MHACMSVKQTPNHQFVSRQLVELNFLLIIYPVFIGLFITCANNLALILTKLCMFTCDVFKEKTMP